MSITLWQYYRDLAARIQEGAFAGMETLQDWEARRPERKREFLRSMGLDPPPPRCDLRVTEHGTFGGEGYRARKVSFQILPDCWSTAAIFLPDPLPSARNPAVLYVCGHAPIGVNFYQDHGMLWARRGYVCLVLDTLEQHDNPGDHHGLYSGERHDWVSLGYTAAGGELWNSLRALDVMESLPEVDPARLGATGHSGGGALSLFLGIADERIRAVASCCGAAELPETLADRHLLAHCDCIYFHNLFQRSTAEYAALTAPRALAFCFADQDSHFSPTENRNLWEQTARIYRLYGCEAKCRLFRYPGRHAYRPETLAFIQRWFDEQIAGTGGPELSLPEKVHAERETTIFNGTPPRPNALRLLPELLSPCGSVALPREAGDWPALRAGVVADLRRNVFAGPWQLCEPASFELVADALSGTTVVRRYRAAVGGMEVWLEMLLPANPRGRVWLGVFGGGADPRRFAYQIADAAGGSNALRDILVILEPRGTHFTAPHPAHAGELLRAGAITGATPVMLAINDILRAQEFLQGMPETAGSAVYLYGQGDQGVAALYAAAFAESFAGVVADGIPATHRDGAFIPGVLRHLDIEQTIGLVAPRPVSVVNTAGRRWGWAQRLYARLGVPRRLFFSATSLTEAFARVPAPEEEAP